MLTLFVTEKCKVKSYRGHMKTIFSILVPRGLLFSSRCLRTALTFVLSCKEKRQKQPRSQDLFPPRPQAREKVLGTRLRQKLTGKREYGAGKLKQRSLKNIEGP